MSSLAGIASELGPFWASGEKSHAPTPHHRQKARQSGRSWHSPDFQAGMVLVLAFALWRWYLPFAGKLLGHMEVFALTPAPGVRFASHMSQLGVLMLHTALSVVAPLLGAIVFAGVALGFLMQGGFRFRLQAIAPDFTRLNPVAGIQHMFSRQAVWLAARGMLKIAAISVVATIQISHLVNQLPTYLVMPLGSMLAAAAYALTGVLLTSAMAFGVIGALDVFVQRSQYEQQLRMSTQELRDEMKDMEGDPRLRGRRRDMMRRLARSGLAAVADATVVVVNPTHYAVALLWDDKALEAPMVVAKGTDTTAWEIRRVAQQSQVPIVENPPAARSLYEVPVGQPVPSAHYQVVADIIAFIIRQRRQGGSS